MTESAVKLTQQHDRIALLKELLIPRVVGLTKCRIGAQADGGYILAQELIPEHRIVYSLGIGDNVSFDLEIAKSCDRVVQFDGDIPCLPQNNPKFVFTNANIDSAAMNENMHSICENEHQNNILLKMDIEGAEYELLAGLEMDNLLKISQICMELHWPAMIPSSVDLLVLLTSEFELLHLHINNNALNQLITAIPGFKPVVDDLPCLLELTFVRKDKCLFSKRETRAFPIEGLDYPNLPNLSDIPANWWLQMNGLVKSYAPPLRILGSKYGTDKASHGFCDYYENAFSKMRPRTTKVLEIGVFFGASLCMWRDWFPNAIIHGADHFTGRQGNGSIFENADKFMREVNNGEHPRIILHQLDQALRSNLEQFAGRHLHGTFDLIVDDASHLMRDQQQTLGALFCLIKPGGFFVIENLQSSLCLDYDVESDRSNSTLLMIQGALTGAGWQSRYMSRAEQDFLNRAVDLTQTRVLGSGGSQTCIIRRKLSVTHSQPLAIVPGTVAIINYASSDELNQLRQLQHIARALKWVQESLPLAGGGIVAAEVICFGPDSLDMEFYRRNHTVLSEKRGGGYWLWKPCIVEAMLAATNAEFLVYCDSGSTINQSLSMAVGTLNTCNASILAFELSCPILPEHDVLEFQWTKGQVLRAMGATDPAISQSNQIAATVSVWRLNDISRKLAHEWLQLMQIPAFATDAPSADGLEDYPGFIEHRHDQSLFSLLLKKQILKDNGKQPTVILKDFNSWIGYHQLG